LKKIKYLEIRKQVQFKLDFFYLARHLLIDSCLLGFSFFLCFHGQGLQYAASPFLAVFLFRSFSIMHEAVHGLVSKNKKLNNFFGVIYGSLCLLPYEAWKESHIEHHYWSGNFEKDPVMALVKIIPTWGPKAEKILNFCWKNWIPAVAFLQNLVFWHLSIKNTLRKKRTAHLVSVLFPLALAVLVTVLVPASLLFQVVIPALLGYLVMIDVVNLPHHLQLPMIRGENKLSVWEQHSISRTCLYPQWVAAHIALNFNYHTEHHLFPDAPWYYLPKLHNLVHTELGTSHNIDQAFQWILENRPKGILQVIRTDGNSDSGSQLAS
jgi:acyl-lipid omega-6 desaturase (Delta-12 desaturase)